METPREVWRDFKNTAMCIGELLVYALQDALIAVDDNIQELPDV